VQNQNFQIKIEKIKKKTQQRITVYFKLRTKIPVFLLSAAKSCLHIMKILLEVIPALSTVVVYRHP
jgi:hypothetical protein